MFWRIFIETGLTIVLVVFISWVIYRTFADSKSADQD